MQFPANFSLVRLFFFPCAFLLQCTAKHPRAGCSTAVEVFPTAFAWLSCLAKWFDILIQKEPEENRMGCMALWLLSC